MFSTVLIFFLLLGAVSAVDSDNVSVKEDSNLDDGISLLSSQLEISSEVSISETNLVNSQNDNLENASSALVSANSEEDNGDLQASTSEVVVNAKNTDKVPVNMSVVSVISNSASSVFKVKLTDSENGNVLSGRMVNLILDGKNLASKTDENGIAVFTTKPLEMGLYDVTLKFAGTISRYSATTVTQEVSVLKVGIDKSKTVWINADSGSDEMKNAVANLLRQKGWTVYVGETYSNAHYTDYFKVTSDYKYYITMYNGFCAGTVREAYSDSIQNTLKSKGVQLVIMWDTTYWTNPQGMQPYRYGDFTGYNAARAWDDNFSVGDPSINNVGAWLKSKNAFYCAYPTAEGLVQQFLSGGYFAYSGT